MVHIKEGYLQTPIVAFFFFPKSKTAFIKKICNEKQYGYLNTKHQSTNQEQGCERKSNHIVTSQMCSSLKAKWMNRKGRHCQAEAKTKVKET